jgi:hypothetical protein
MYARGQVLLLLSTCIKTIGVPVLGCPLVVKMFLLYDRQRVLTWPAKTYYTRPRRRRWKQLVPTSWLSVGAMRDDRRRRLSAATGREGPGAGVLYAAL